MPADKGVRAGAGAFGGGLEIDAAVHCDAIRKLSFAPPGLGLLDFRQRFVDELLSAEARIDGHHQQQVNLVEIWLDVGDGGGRVDGQADFFAERLDFPDEWRDLLVKFDMNDDFGPRRPWQRVRSKFAAAST